MEKFIDIANKFCPTTLTINLTTLAISMTDAELILKLLSYAVAIVWTTIKVIKEIKNWNGKK